MIIQALIWFGIIAFMIIGIWEALALLTGQKIIPTWSRLVRSLWKNRPERKRVIFIITLVLGFAVTIWLAIHFITGW